MPEEKFVDILYEKADGIAWITINRPEKYNGFRTKTIEEMTSAVKEADTDPGIRVIVITGAGEKAFCSGADVDEFAEEIFPNPAKARTYLEKFIGLRDAITGAGKPVIAAVNGYCIAGGHEIHLWCDITIASENARLGQGGVKVGSAPIFGGSQLFAKNVGEKRARYQMYTAEPYTAKEAEQMGLVNKVVPLEKLKETVVEVARKIMANSPQSIRFVKAWTNFTSQLERVTYELAKESLIHVWYTDEAREGIKAFLEKRKPEWDKYKLV